MTITLNIRIRTMFIRYFTFSILSIIFLNSCQNPKKYNYINGKALGTSFSIIYDDNHDFSHAIDSLFSVVNHSLSTYHKNSIISKINKGDSLAKIDSHFKTVYTKAKRIYKETKGLFDPTVGTLVNAYGFGPEKPINNIDSVQLQKLMQLVGFDKVKIQNNTIYKENPQIYIDFNAIAKGYAIDVIGKFLEEKSIKNYMVEVGGEVRVRGVNSKNKLWKIGIEKPLTDGSRALETTVSLENKAMATSGNYRKFKIDTQGRKFVHTINPKTGLTAQNDLLSATVIAQLDCADVDGYATSFMVMGFQNTLDFLKNHPELEVFLIYIDENGITQTYTNIKK